MACKLPCSHCFTEEAVAISCPFCKIIETSYKKHVEINFMQKDQNKCSRKSTVDCTNCNNELHIHQRETFSISHEQFIEKFKYFVGDRPNIRKISFRHHKPIWIMIKLINKTQNYTAKQIELFCSHCMKTDVKLVTKPGPFKSDVDLEKVYRESGDCIIMTKTYFHFTNRFMLCGDLSYKDIMIRDICRDIEYYTPK